MSIVNLKEARTAAAEDNFNIMGKTDSIHYLVIILDI